LERYDEALVWYDKCLERDPNYIYAYNNKGNALYSLKRSDEALVWFDKCLERDPNYISAYYNKGLALRGLKRHDEALVWFDKCLERDPNHILALNGKGNALSYLNRSDEALVWFDKCLERDPNFIYALNGKGNALRGLKRDDEALVWFDKCLERDPNYALAKNNRDLALAQIDLSKAAYAAGCAHCDRGDAAIDTWSHLRRLLPTPFNRSNSDATSSSVKKEKIYAKAIAEFDKCLALNPNHVQAHHGKGLALKRLQRHDEAILCSEKCLELDGDFLLSHCRHRTLATGFDLIVGEEDLAGLVSWFMTALEQTGKSRQHPSLFLSHHISTFLMIDLDLQRRELLRALCVSSRQASTVWEF
jgi:tetratricopeptide (TPR) repeat protein